VGGLALVRLVREMENPETNDDTDQILRTELVVRSSCGKARGELLSVN
jgi:hypothetical protein